MLEASSSSTGSVIIHTENVASFSPFAIRPKRSPAMLGFPFAVHRTRCSIAAERLSVHPEKGDLRFHAVRSCFSPETTKIPAAFFCGCGEFCSPVTHE